MHILDTLKQYGLSEAEAKIYLTLLKEVEASVFTLSKKTGIPRTTVYTNLESLKNQGLVLDFKKDSVLYYTPESPHTLVKILDTKRENIQSIMPNLDALIGSSEVKPQIRLYTGKEGVRSVKEDIISTLRSSDEKILRCIANGDMFKLLPKYFPTWVEKRAQEKIHAQLILPYEAKKDKKNFIEEENVKVLREVRFLPAGMQYNCSVNIYGNKVAFFSLKKSETSAVILESHTISDMFKQFFVFNWEILK